MTQIKAIRESLLKQEELKKSKDELAMHQKGTYWLILYNKKGKRLLSYTSINEYYLSFNNDQPYIWLVSPQIADFQPLLINDDWISLKVDNKINIVEQALANVFDVDDKLLTDLQTGQAEGLVKPQINSKDFNLAIYDQDGNIVPLWRYLIYLKAIKCK